MKSNQLYKLPFKPVLLTSIIFQVMTLSAFAEPLELPIIQIHAVPTHQDLLTTPASVQKIVNDKAQQQSNVNLSEQLQGIAGLQVNNRENYAQDLQISMRGFGARSTFGVRGIRLYVDGIPATMPDGQGQSSNIDLNSLRQLEVLSGPFSSIYGNSSGGTILTQTQEGQGRDSLQLGYVGGSHGKQQLNVQLQGGSDQASQPAYVISSSYFDTDGYREHSAARKALHNAKLTWNLDDGSKINWVLNHVDIRADDAAGLSRADWKADRKQQASTLKAFDVRKTILQTQTGLTWTKPIDAHNELYSMAYLGNRQVQQYQSIPQKPQLNPRHAGGVIDFDRNYYGVDLRWKNTDWLPNTTIIAGLAYDAMQEDRKGYENFDADGHYGVKGQLRRDEKNTLWNLDPYVQASWQFLPAWHFNAGLRYSNVHYKSADHYIRAGNGDDSGRQSYDKVLPSVALGWNILPSLYSYISYAQGFETPTFTEMAYPTVGSSGMNFDLQASSSDTYEWGLKSQNPYGLFTAAVFQTNTKNDIVPDDANAGRSTFRNADKTLRQGVELTWQKDVWQDLKLRTSYSYLDATFAADIPATNSKALITKGTYIPGIAKNQAFASVAWQPQQGIQAGLDIRYMDKLFVDDMNSDQAPSYTVAGAYVGYVWRNQDWTLNSFARVDNLFDKDYVGSVIVNDGNQRFFEPADGRNVSLGLSIRRAF